MDDSELQELSRKAVGCLPEEVRKNLRAYKGCVNIGPKNAPPIWLHESTEACTEIMVRVLLGPDFLLYGYPAVPIPIFADGPIDASTRIKTGGREIIVWHADCGNDSMFAYRVAVLRTLIALSYGSRGQIKKHFLSTL